MAVIMDRLRDQSRGAKPGTAIEVVIPDPDLARGLYSGERYRVGDDVLRVRGLAAWADLAEVLDLRLAMPRPLEAPFVALRFEVLDRSADLHEALPEDAGERYGRESPFARVHKTEDPWFIKTYRAALASVSLRRGDAVLFVGCGRGDEIEVFSEAYPDIRPALRVEGIDWSPTSLEIAEQRFPWAAFSCRDLSEPGALKGNYQLVVAIGLLQSPRADGKNLVSRLIAHHLGPRSAMIIGWPNVRYLDGVARFGARSKNDADGELGLVVRDLAHYRKLFQKKGFEVTIKGKYDLFLTAVRAG